MLTNCWECSMVYLWKIICRFHHRKCKSRVMYDPTIFFQDIQTKILSEFTGKLSYSCAGLHYSSEPIYRNQCPLKDEERKKI